MLRWRYGQVSLVPTSRRHRAAARRRYAHAAPTVAARHVRTLTADDMGAALALDGDAGLVAVLPHLARDTSFLASGERTVDADVAVADSRFLGAMASWKRRME